MCLRMNSPATSRVGNGGCPGPTRHTERQKISVDLLRTPCQRMAQVDDLLERRAKQVVLAIVARLAHWFPPTANLAVEGITDRPNQEIQTAIKPACTPGFLAKSITCSGQIIAIDQSLPNFFRTTIERPVSIYLTGIERTAVAGSVPALVWMITSCRRIESTV